MKTAFILATFFVAAQSFGVAPVAQNRVSTILRGEIPEDQLSGDMIEIQEIRKKWNEIRHLDRDEAQKTLDGEWLEAYNRFYKKYDDDMERMEEIVEKLGKMIEPPKVQKKTKGQKRRDAYARNLEHSDASS